MNRRMFLQTVAAPAVTGLAISVFSMNEGDRQRLDYFAVDGLPVNHEGFLHDVAYRLHLKLAPLEVNEQMLSMKTVRAIIEDHMRTYGLVDSNIVATSSVSNFKGRYQILMANDTETFLPKMGVVMYPDRTGYKNGVMVKAEYRS